jgi:hypothetical protein
MLWLFPFPFILLAGLLSTSGQVIEQIHLSMTTDPTKWGLDCVAHVEGSIQVEYCNTASDSSCNVALNVSSPVYIAEIGYLHQIILEGLELKSEYKYRIQTSTGVWTNDYFYFTTGPYGREDFVRRGDSSDGHTTAAGAVVAVYADLGLYNGLSTSRLLYESQNHTFDYALHVGDICKTASAM